MERTQAPDSALALRLGKEIPDQHVEEIQRIIGSANFEITRHRKQRGNSSIFSHAGDSLSAHRVPVASQGGEAAGRDAPEIEISNPESAHLFESPQRLDHPVPTHPCRGPAKAVKRREAGVLRDREKALQLNALLGAGDLAERPPQSCGCTFSDPRHQPSQCRDAWEKNFLFDQPSGGMVEEHAWSFGAQRRARVEPPHKVKHLPGITEFAVAIAFSDLEDVAPSGVITILPETVGVGDLKLAGKVGDRTGGHLGGLGEESPQETNRGQLDSEPELVVVSVTAGDAPPIGLVEMEVLGELLPGGLAGEAAVALLLRGREEVNRHRRKARTTRDNSLVSLVNTPRLYVTQGC